MLDCSLDQGQGFLGINLQIHYNKNILIQNDCFFIFLPGPYSAWV